MPQVNIQTQNQTQVQNLTPLQVLQVRLLELPIQELQQRVENELLENEALLASENEDENDTELRDGEENENWGRDASEGVLSDPEDDDYDMNAIEHNGSSGIAVEDYNVGGHTSFREELLSQAGECDLTKRQRVLVEYLINSLDDDGFLRKETWKISDELLLNWNIDVSDTELTECLEVIQQFDPAGIGARNLQECLLLQLQRINPQSDALLQAKIDVIQQCFDEFKGNRWDKIAARLQLPQEEVSRIKKEIAKLNPRPGGGLDDTMGGVPTIIPDLVLNVEDDGTLDLQLNTGRIPELYVSRSYADAVDEYNRNRDNMSKQAKAEFAYTREKVEHAKGFINAVKQRNATILNTMNAILQIQHDYFVEGDESLLKPMLLKDVAALAKVDISTVSRVCNSKYIQTPYGIFALKHFFGNVLTQEDDEDGVSKREIKNALKKLIEEEDKNNPLPDVELTAKMNKLGYPVARRTVAKYREQLGFPVAKMRKQ